MLGHWLVHRQDLLAKTVPEPNNKNSPKGIHLRLVLGVEHLS